MKRLTKTVILLWLMAALLPLQAGAQRLLIPVGRVIGLQLRDGQVTVAAYDEHFGQAAREAGIKIGDVIREVDGEAVSSAEEVRQLLRDAGQTVSLTLRRNGRDHILTFVPGRGEEGARLGLYLKQGIAGIGTVTWYDPASHTFGTLGHGVSSSRGELLAMTGGSVWQANIAGVRKGKPGEPGLLKGNITSADSIGSLLKNTPQGVFGEYTPGWIGELLPVADYSDVHTGQAHIRSTIAGEDVQEYSVEILKIYPEERRDSRNFLLKVTDPRLLEVTGGIVQGMSGSPIIQDGKLVGAVTHVLVSDSTRGYGIFIGNMLDAAA